MGGLTSIVSPRIIKLQGLRSGLVKKRDSDVIGRKGEIVRNIEGIDSLNCKGTAICKCFSMMIFCEKCPGIHLSIGQASTIVKSIKKRSQSIIFEDL